MLSYTECKNMRKWIKALNLTGDEKLAFKQWWYEKAAERKERKADKDKA